MSSHPTIPTNAMAVAHVYSCLRMIIPLDGYGPRVGSRRRTTMIPLSNTSFKLSLRRSFRLDRDCAGRHIQPSPGDLRIVLEHQKPVLVQSALVDRSPRFERAERLDIVTHDPWERDV